GAGGCTAIQRRGRAAGNRRVRAAGQVPDVAREIARRKDDPRDRDARRLLDDLAGARPPGGWPPRLAGTRAAPRGRGASQPPAGGCVRSRRDRRRTGARDAAPGGGAVRPDLHRRGQGQLPGLLRALAPPVASGDGDRRGQRRTRRRGDQRGERGPAYPGRAPLQRDGGGRATRERDRDPDGRDEGLRRVRADPRVVALRGSRACRVARDSRGGKLWRAPPLDWRVKRRQRGADVTFAFSEEQQELRSTAARFLEEKSSSAIVRQLMETDTGFDEGTWKQMADLGWLGMAIPEEYGGVGFGFVEVLVLLEEMGKKLLPAPYVSSVLFGANAILNAGSEDQKKELLPGIADGTTRATLAFVEPSGRWDIDGIELEAKDGKLTGTKSYVLDGHT